MLKQIIYVLTASLVVVLGMTYLHVVLNWLLEMHMLLQNWLIQVFANNYIGTLLTGLLSLFVVPVVLAFVIAGIYWAFKRKSFPMLPTTLWAIWLILSTILIMQR